MRLGLVSLRRRRLTRPNRMKDRSDEVIRATAELFEVLQDELASSQESLPSTRCIGLGSLKPIIKAAQSKLLAPVFRKHSASRIVQLLTDSGLLTPIPLGALGPKGPPPLYAVGFNLPALPSVFEVLQAFRPKGVLCYFSALELHGLTTQPAPQYHVATLRQNSENAERSFPQSDKPHSLGMEAFTYEGVDCYVTSREKRNLRAIQRRQLNSQSIATVTTLEQTLLDCLHRPASVGGPSVVFEAWEVGTSRISTDRMWKLLVEIADVRLVRRVGYMLEMNGGDVALLESIREIADLQSSEYPQETLLPGIPYVNTNNKWQLRTA